MFSLPKRALYTLTADSPTTIEEITSRDTLTIQDFDGQGRTYTLSKPCAKVVIYNSHHLTLHLTHLPLSSTLELFSSSHITLLISPPSDSGPLGTLQLDPKLDDVHIQFERPETVGSIVLAPLLGGEQGARSFGFRDLTLQVGDEEVLELVDPEGRIHAPGTQGGGVIDPNSEEAKEMPRQWVVKRSEGSWEAQGLKRSSGVEYPLL